LNSDEGLAKAVNRLIAERSKLKRTHASFFLAPRGFKVYEENDVALEFVRWLEGNGNESISSIDRGDDPPDIVLGLSDGRKFGLEVTELVNQAAIEADIRNDPSYDDELFNWDKDSTRPRIEERIAAKQPAAANLKGSYDRYIVLLYTDELLLTSTELASFIEGHAWPTYEGIDASYVLGSYEPSNGYPVTELFST